MQIRDLRSDTDLAAVEQLQREVWGFSDLDVVSGSILRVMLEIGGVLVGVFEGTELVAWTFDPLRSRNAYFNFRKLGALSNEYRVNFYGETTSSFLHSIGTDRLWITWILDRERMVSSQGAGEVVEIPRDIDSLSNEEQWNWRKSTRSRFSELIADGYCVTDYDGNGRYTLQRGSLEDFTR